MKVLFVAHHLKGNDGWSRYARDLIGSLKKEGVEVLCLVNELSPETDIPQKQCLGEPLKYIVNPILSFKTASAVNAIIREFSPDIIHFIVEPYGTIIPFVRKGEAKIVMTVHSTFAFLPILVSGFKRIFSNYIMRLTYVKIDSVICVSKYTKEHLLRHMSAIKALSLIENKMIILAGGIDPMSIKERPVRPASKTGEILFVGALKRRKGLKEAIEALALVKQDFVYRVVGVCSENDSYIMLLKKKIAEYGLEKKVVFAGQVSDFDLQKMYEKADLFLMLSTNNGADFEGYGLVYLEANAHGVPCIGPNDSGVSDAIIEGKTGYLVNQYDAPAVAKTIEHVLRNRPIAPADCVAWARENSIEKKAKIIITLYQSIRA